MNLPMLIRLESARKVMGVHAAGDCLTRGGAQYISSRSEILGKQSA